MVIIEEERVCSSGLADGNIAIVNLTTGLLASFPQKPADPDSSRRGLFKTRLLSQGGVAKNTPKSVCYTFGLWEEERGASATPGLRNDSRLFEGPRVAHRKPLACGGWGGDVQPLQVSKMTPVFSRGLAPPAGRCVQRPVPKLDFCPRGRGKEGTINSLVKGLEED
ncbi:hypothetical protein WN943_029125 [Citrus x changshan-huyou]